ncbi:cysteine ABC transporter substrate-binding protein [Clostridium saccharobutylicum]|uniref:cysteine ABC transporter substrate-binding protein n=1 Tax=Clostridium saccharobutylicum TaxID=169679 RepID=UPI00156E0246|nr:cysteine ABC transporter substrate-binding protein [Clostridium saccharobutylicum]NSB89088.1 polar amino acid transport system substrate-binding protein [Clostridium saccharobutylicum]NYC30937.1 polar amino acid transport system substrate-binding protein [Clostridium saccharobutylicum]
MKKIKKIVATLLLSTVVIGGFAGCSNSASTSKGNSNDTSASSIQDIKNRGTIKIGVFSDKAPFGYVDSDGKNQGFDVYLAKRFAKDLLGDESKVEFVLVDAASRVSYLESKKVDIIMANFTVTDERKQKVDFANPYMKVSLGIVSPDDNKITSADQLKGKKVIVAKGTTAETYMTKNYPDVELVKYEQYSEIFQALKDKRGDAIVSDNTEVIAWAKDNPGFTVGVSSLGSPDTIAPAVTKGNTELKDWINTELETLGKENFVHKAYDETLKSVYGTEFEDSLVVEGGKIE